jgi:hypothetical protein
MFKICLTSANHALLVLLPLVRPRRLPAHPPVAPPQRLIPLSKHMRPLRPRHTPLPQRKLRPPVVLACLGRWLPPQVPSPSGQLSAMASLRCSLAAAPSLHPWNSSTKLRRSKIRPHLRLVARYKRRSSQSVLRRPTCRAARGTSSSSRL